MSRYIEIDTALLKTVATGGLSAKALWKRIMQQPSIDIVRCRECVKANTKDCSHSYWDDDWGVWRIGYKGDDWFCADGEREGE